jgi:hypothetical protein
MAQILQKKKHLGIVTSHSNHTRAQTFENASKVLYIVTLCRTYTRTLTFQNLFAALRISGNKQHRGAGVHDGAGFVLLLLLLIYIYIYINIYIYIYIHILFLAARLGGDEQHRVRVLFCFWFCFLNFVFGIVFG